MLFRDALKTATKSLRQGKLRSTLTMLGIVIGISSVIILMSIGRSAQQLILGQIESVGSNLIVIIPGAPSGSGFSPPASQQGIVIATLKARDVSALEREASILAVTPIVSGQAEAVYGSNNKTITYQGASADIFTIENLPLAKGSYFSKGDVDSGSHVVIIGPDIATTLFGAYMDPINKNIRLKDQSFRVVGVLDKGGTGAFGADMGNLIIMPITVAQKQLLGINHFNNIIVKGNDQYSTDFTKSRITFALRQTHGITDPKKDDFEIRTQEDILSILGTITSALTLFLAAIAAISLLVGGIGIMNIMLVAVTERTREIGLRKAVGATDGDILQQFLIESVLLTLSGGILGIAVGTGIVGLIYVAVTALSSVTWVFELPLSAILLGLGVSCLAGIAFGIYPARQAGKKNPIDALRYE
jgi:putative ABC transport system permease protein